MNSPNKYIIFLNQYKKNKILYLIISLSVCFSLSGGAQEIDPNGQNIFYYPNGRVASEGYFKDGLPTGIWTNYYADGTLKSIGKKEKGLSDSLWAFFDEEGRKTQVFDFFQDHKYGCATFYDTSGNRIKELFYWNDIPQVEELTYYANGSLRKRIELIEGKAEGFAYEYDTMGIIITQELYDNGFLKERNTYNRIDENGLKTGIWRTYFPNGQLETEVVYKDGTKEGLAKRFDKKGKLVDLQEMEGDSIAGHSEDIVIIELYKEFYPSGNQKLVGGLDNGVRTGIYREYDEAGKIINGYIYDHDTIVAEGLIRGDGVFEGDWILYYKNGVIKAKGTYVNSRKEGKWIYYYENGRKEQEGNLKDNQLSGEWNWYYPNGKLQRKEFYNRKELLEGTVYEYDSLGNEITRGDYVNGIREGEWFYHVGDYKEVGAYSLGLEDGIWKSYYKNGKLAFIGEYNEGEAKGKHIYFYMNGIQKKSGKYLGGEKHGKWFEYNEQGEVIQIIEYKRGEIYKIDGFKVEPITENSVN